MNDLIDASATTMLTASVVFMGNNSQEVVRIEANGNIFWNGRRITTDEEFRQTMMAMHECLQQRIRR